MNKFLLLAFLINFNFIFSSDFRFTNLSMLRALVHFNLSPADKKAAGVSDFDNDKDYFDKLKVYYDRKDSEAKARRLARR